MSQDPSFRPSSADRWMVCGASVVVDVPPRPSGPHADRGKRLHEIAEACLRDEKIIPIPSDTLTFEDCNDVMAYIVYVRRRGGEKYFEVPTSFIPGQQGFVDCAVANESSLEIIDYKSGYGLVSPVENHQLIIYACGLVDKFALLHEFNRVKLTIVQPSRENFSAWPLMVEELVARGKEILARVESIKAGDATFHPAPEACLWCDAKTLCPARDAAAQDAARVDFAARGEDPPEVATKADLTQEDRLVLAGIVGPWAKDQEAEAKRMLLDGEKVPGFKVVEGRKSRAWHDVKKAVGLLTTWGFGERDIYTDPVFVSPAVAEKLFKATRASTKGEKEEAKERKIDLATCIQTNDGPPTMVPESDPRPVMEKKDLAARDFADIEEEN